jgi:protein involved in polysaccharide export with SLBB domain
VKKPSFVVLLASSLLAVYGCSNSSSVSRDTYTEGTHTSTTTQLVESDSSIVMAGDSVFISVWGYPEFNTRAQIRPNGTIILPLVGEVFASGFTRRDFIQHIRRKLSEYIPGDIRLSIEVMHPIPRITVLGRVSRQGSIPTNSDVPLLEVFSSVGGWTDDSDLRYIKITRQSTLGSERNVVEVDLAWHLESGTLRSVPLVRPGDVVYVPKKENFIRDLSDLLRDAFLIFGFFGFIR